MNIKKIAVSELQAADYNPRKDLQPGDPEFEKLKRSVEEFGYVEPVIFNEATGRVVGGHQRLKVLTALGHEAIECVVVNLDEAKEKALNVALNKVKGEWDESKLALLIADLTAEDFDVTLTGFDPAEVDALFRDQLAGGIEEDDFDVEAELAKPAMSRTGDIWQLGRHKLIVGDSTDPATFEALMAGERANLVVTDPPYNVNYQGSAGSIQNDHMDNDSFVAFLTKAFAAVSSVMADDASIYVLHSDTGGYAFRKAFDDAGFYLSGCCIWVKQSIVLGRSPYQRQHEPVLFGWKKKGRHQWYTGRKESTIWRFDKPRKNTDHPTMKPVELIAYPILNSSLSNQIILDAFGGSGSTLVAAEQTGRVARLVELDPKYADVIINRYKELAGAISGIKAMRDGQELSFEDAQEEVEAGDSDG
ncbi:DNA modification methylase [Canibacter sp. lx-72]|uniref:site-specific DNA-methyltransferase n=1 Tax=Canibacter zhuwentaonis TaxID=2837491 RepID=UPI001BDC61D5|nr:site-specific DNA-methyltransferase [Canibacter zhuwentaonis]MBT1017592.1 DNA modification methylase [Canibacter zhuwentaonis]